MSAGATASSSEALQPLAWQHHISLYTDQLVISVDVNEGTQSAGIRLAVSDLKMETSLELGDTGVHLMCCILNTLYSIILFSVKAFCVICCYCCRCVHVNIAELLYTLPYLFNNCNEKCIEKRSQIDLFLTVLICLVGIFAFREVLAYIGITFTIAFTSTIAVILVFS